MANTVDSKSTPLGGIGSSPIVSSSECTPRRLAQGPGVLGRQHSPLGAARRAAPALFTAMGSPGEGGGVLQIKPLFAAQSSNL